MGNSLIMTAILKFSTYTLSAISRTFHILNIFGCIYNLQILRRKTHFITGWFWIKLLKTTIEQIKSLLSRKIFRHKAFILNQRCQLVS